MKLINFREIEAIIFDFDGVIFDTEPLWFKASINTLKKLKYKFDNKIIYQNTIGLESDRVFDLLLNTKIDKKNLKKINYLYNKESKKIFQRNLKPFAYLKTFFKKYNFEKFIVSNSEYDFINNLLVISDLKKYFKSENIISCSKLGLKPKPAGYIKAIKIIKKNKKKILVIEDSENGITAAKNAKISNILRFTNNNINFSKNTIHKDIKNIKSYKQLL
tara:strand:- start:1193 stop:1846 length:654 start_codon:yes stop_codon:yes gene_type:complete